MTVKPTERRMATIKHAAEYVDCSERTIRRRIADGSLVHYRRGRMIRVDLNDIDRWLKPVGLR